MTRLRCLQQLLVEQEVSELASLVLHHLAEGSNLSSQVTLTLVLFIEEVTSEIVDKLSEEIAK